MSGLVAVAEQVGDHQLVPCGGVQVGGLLEAEDRVDHVGRSRHPADPQPGGEHLGRGSDVHDRTQGSEQRTGGRSPPEVPVGSVLDHQDLVRVGQLAEAGPAARAHHGPGRVVVVGHHVDDPRCVPRRDQGVERLDVESPVVAREPDDRGARGPEGLDRAQVGRLLQRDLVAGGDHGAGQQVEALLGPRGDHDLVGVDPQSLAHRFSQRRQTGGRPVLQRDRAVGAAE